ncbi:DNA helicase UvrD [Bifidobacterium aemilianum]|uniref:DNA helicase UvrD n=1 Tax=Bifidobacterium aemilianum TaxID=2493120 RepID=A0A366KA70_9BIFI|nr:PD-(D/E)XK nuclease family protein [Bifidobacterium aemilianum]RBP98645.1 DNA helicase UvrD [Bifidobacterium aemilianum]
MILERADGRLNPVRQLLDGTLHAALADRADSIAPAASTLLVQGPPRSGKTSFALDSLLLGLRELGDTRATMAVSNRLEAADLANQVIRRATVSAQARPVTTLSAVAFGLVQDVRAAEGLTPPKLLNGAEEDALLRQVMLAHIRHAQAGDSCDSCGLLRDYFAADSWVSLLSDMQTQGTGANPPVQGAQATTEALLTRGLNSAFIMQLRDMLARMDELGASPQEESAILGALDMGDPRSERLALQWRLAFALRQEYDQAVAQAYATEFRLDASRLLVEGTKAVARAREAQPLFLPGLLVVDDVQDLTLAGLSFLQALSQAGSKLLLLGNPDESVQAFRGSYPEYVLTRLQEAPFTTAALRLSGPDSPVEAVPTSAAAASGGVGAEEPQAPDYRSLIASRVSLSIASPQEETLPLPQRPGKLPRYQHALPISPIYSEKTADDASLLTACYRSAAEELEDVIWRIKRAHLDQGRQWNDMALIAHDNATVRAFGERLRRDGVPVRYSSVTKPLKEEPVVQGLFALVELGRLRHRGLEASGMGLAQAAGFVHSRVRSLMASPLIVTSSGMPARIEPVEGAMKSLASLAQLLERSGEAADADLPQSAQVDASAVADLLASWRRLLADRAAAQAAIQVQVDDALLGAGEKEADLPFSQESLMLLLALDGKTSAAAQAAGESAGPVQASGAGRSQGVASSGQVLKAIMAVCGKDPQAKAFAHLWDLVDTVAAGLADLPSPEPQYVLYLAWDACKVAKTWQRQALDNTDQGRAANDRLDVAMRLFTYAASDSFSSDTMGFLAQVRSMEIEADSLAKLAPVDQALTLTTPAGAAGGHWPLVWIVQVQEDVWPNLAPRNTMFGGEQLARIVLNGHLDEAESLAFGGSDPLMAALLASEQKSFLLALTRADDQLTISCVCNDDLVPSDFLYGYLPERFDREVWAEPASRPYAQVGQGDAFAGLDTDLRGLVAAARVRLAEESMGLEARAEAGDLAAQLDDRYARDAAQALALLVSQGVALADPDAWSFLEWQSQDCQQPELAAVSAPAAPEDSGHSDTVAAQAPQVTLSPSAVDDLWGCPVCWLLEKQFAGPRPGSAAAGFGSVIHQVAQEGSEAGLDRPDFMPQASAQERFDAALARMMDIYRSLRIDPQTISDAQERYQAMRKDQDAQSMIETVAHYFLESNQEDYLGRNAQNFSIGSFEEAQCERSFNASFTLADILAAYRSIPGAQAMSQEDLYAIMGALVGGWPQGMDPQLTIRLTGRIDRLERRRMADGSQRIRLIDYKTGRLPSTRDVFNDLQLVCYQLGLAFPEDRQGEGVLAGLPTIGQSNLFHLATAQPPGAYHGAAEGRYQPPLFLQGHLNDSAFVKRSYLSNPVKVHGLDPLGQEPPEGVGSQTWQGFLDLRGGQAVWALTMIARVFYAGAASRSQELLAHPQDSHVKHCRMLSVCPACAGQVNTVFEVRKS